MPSLAASEGVAMDTDIVVPTLGMELNLGVNSLNIETMVLATHNAISGSFKTGG